MFENKMVALLNKDVEPGVVRNTFVIRNFLNNFIYC
jgi:hypothetical protein